MSGEIFITGIGIVSPAGWPDAETTWESLVRGGRHIRPLSEVHLDGYETPLGGQVPDFLPPSGTELSDRVCQFAVAAADQAMASAGLAGGQSIPANPLRTKVCMGTSKGGVISFAQMVNRSGDIVYKTPVALESLSSIPPDAPARHLAARYNIRGGMHATVAACTTGTLAVVRAAQFIEDGDADIVLAGSSDASLCPLWFAAFERMGVLAAADPERGSAWTCRPFDRTRQGFVLGEGAAVLVLESARSMNDRGSRPIARVAGWATGTDPAGLAQVTSDGGPLAHVVRVACRRAGCRLDGFSCIHAHGTGTQANDRAETRAIRQAIGPQVHRVPIVSIKGAIGHLLGAAGAVELAVATLSCWHGVSPGTTTLIASDPEFADLNLPTRAFELRSGPILKTSLGFGGHLAAVILSQV